MKKLSLIQLLFSFLIVKGQTPSIQWERTFGGSADDDAIFIRLTNDKGSITVGMSKSSDGDLSNNYGNFDLWVIKLDSLGHIEWEKALGSSGYDDGRSIIQTSDGGYLIVGTSGNNDGDVTNHYGGGKDLWVVKLSHSGNLEWQKSYGGSSTDVALSVIETWDNKYVVSGYSSSTDGNVTGNHGMWDYWILKLDTTGSMLWQKSFGGSGNDVPRMMTETLDGNYTICGVTLSNDGDVTGNHGLWDYWILKLDTTGSMLWQKNYGGTGYDIAYGIESTADKGYIVTGASTSNNGDVLVNYGNFDYWILKLDSLGVIEWQKSFGGSGNDYGRFIHQTSDGGYITTGYSNSDDFDLMGNHGGSDYWTLKLTPSGNIEWQTVHGGSNDDVARCIRQIDDNRYIIAGSSLSSDEDVTNNNGANDYWVVKLDISTYLYEHSNLDSFVFPNPSSGIFYVNGLSTSSQVEVFDLSGKLVLSQGSVYNSPYKLDLSNFDNGIYIYQIKTAEKLLQGKLVKH